MTVSENHRIAGEVFGTVCWLWVLHRARNDLPVVLGFRHPWEHAPGDDHHGGHGEHGAPTKTERATGWDKFSSKSTRYDEDDDDDEEEGDE
jgi:hypothetical protein